jgi:hypothetical protein
MSGAWVGQALDYLRANVASANHMANVEGLFARHLLKTEPRLSLQWVVDCDDDWLLRMYDPTNLAAVAALAYTIEHTGRSAWHDDLEEGMKRATARDPKSAGPGAALHDPGVLIGLCLGARSLKDGPNPYTTWCLNVLTDLLSVRNARRVDPMLAYAIEVCGGPPRPLSADIQAPLSYRAALDWWIRQAESRVDIDVAGLLSLRRSVVEEVLSEPLSHLPAHQSALLWKCLREAASESSAAALQTAATIAHMLSQFESALKRWRWDAESLQRPVRWKIRSEREVQDILWLLLRPHCLDLEDEDTLPKFGHSTYRADFGVPSLGLLIEAKFARAAGDFKDIEKEVLEDLVPYLKAPERYREVLVFIYDDSCSVQHHDTTIRALRSVTGISDVIIACRPSQLPRAASQE